MAKIGTTFTKSGKKAVLCGSGELGKEVAIELQRYGVEVVALDKYANAPAMHVAHSNHVFPMLDGDKLKSVIIEEKPDFIIPEIEAIATDKLVELEAEGYNVIPTAKATQLTMNREGIRRLAAETLGLPTSPYRFAATREEFALVYLLQVIDANVFAYMHDFDITDDITMNVEPAVISPYNEYAFNPNMTNMSGQNALGMRIGIRF